MRIKAINTLEIHLPAGADSSFEHTLNNHIDGFEHTSGCLGYCVSRSVSDPQSWVVSGYWDDVSNMTNHFSSEALAELTQWLVALRASLIFGTFEPALAERQ